MAQGRGNRPGRHGACANEDAKGDANENANVKASARPYRNATANTYGNAIANTDKNPNANTFGNPCGTAACLAVRHSKAHNATALSPMLFLYYALTPALTSGV